MQSDGGVKFFLKIVESETDLGLKKYISFKN